MNQPAESESSAAGVEVPAAPSNTVATIGLLLTGVSILMCALLFVIANQLTENDKQRLANAETRALKLRDAAVAPEPLSETDGDEEFDDDFPVEDRLVDVPAMEAEFRKLEAEEQAAHEAEQLRLLLLAAVAVALNAVGVVLSIAGLVVPGRPRGIAIIGTVLGCLLLAGLFGVMVVGSLLNPPMAGEESVSAAGGLQRSVAIANRTYQI